MADFSIISQDPTIRNLVQDNLLSRAFHDALFPRMLFRMEASPEIWPGNIGDVQLFTGKGLMPVSMAPIKPGVDPIPGGFQYEQWSAQLNMYANTIDTNMPTNMVALADLFLSNAATLGLNAAQSMNRVVRDRIYDAALSGQTVCDGAQAAVTVLAVKRLNGLTTARNPNLAAGSPVAFAPVSSSNPLAVSITTTTGTAARTIIGYSSTNPGDQIGPGTITLAGGAVTVNDRGPVITVDASNVIRVGGGKSVDSITGADTFTLAAIRSANAYLRQQNVPTFGDGCYHAHLDPVSESQLFDDSDLKQLFTALPDSNPFQDFAIGRLLGTVFLRDTECPVAETVLGGPLGVYDPNDQFAGELTSNGLPYDGTNTKIHRPLFIGQGAVLEKYTDLGLLISDAGVTGKVGEFQITNNGIEVMVERIQLILRAPLDRLQNLVSTSWKFIGDWPVRTDATTGGPARYKRTLAVECGES